MIRRAASTLLLGMVALALTTLPAAARPAASQQAELLPSDPNTYPFGWSVAVDGTTAVVGVPGNIEGDQAGVAYVFVKFGDEWSQEAELTVGGSDDQFGSSVAISGDTLVVGAPLSANFAGAAYVFVRSNDVWTQQAELLASDGAVNDFFGGSVAMSGSTVVVGAPSHDSIGAAYVFDDAGGSWSQEAELTTTGSAGDAFGASVAVDGDEAIIGAPRWSDDDTGEVHVFHRSLTGWSERTVFTPSEFLSGELFGSSVALEGDTAVVGAPAAGGHGSLPGQAFVFHHTEGNNWSRQARLVPFDSAVGDLFGQSVALVGTSVIVGAPFAAPNHSGSVDVFVLNERDWSQVGKLTSVPRTHAGGLGFAVAVSGSTVVAGAPYCCPANINRGAAFVFLIA